MPGIPYVALADLKFTVVLLVSSFQLLGLQAPCPVSLVGFVSF